VGGGVFEMTADVFEFVPEFDQFVQDAGVPFGPGIGIPHSLLLVLPVIPVNSISFNLCVHPDIIILVNVN